MNKPQKMNILFKLALIAFCLCLLALGGTIVSYCILQKTKLSLALGAGGVVLSLIGIILCMLSKPKPVKEAEKLENTPEQEEKDEKQFGEE